VPPDDRAQRARDLYRAFATADRDTVERTLADDFRFSSPLDVGLDRHGYFERCWPGAGQGQEFEFVRVLESGDEVIVTYELKRADGGRGRNTEILTFKGDQVSEVEVYFGWDIECTPVDRESASRQLAAGGWPGTVVGLIERDRQSSHRRLLRWTTSRSTRWQCSLSEPGPLSRSGVSGCEVLGLR
jgi:hypothetical protein